MGAFEDYLRETGQEDPFGGVSVGVMDFSKPPPSTDPFAAFQGEDQIKSRGGASVDVMDFSKPPPIPEPSALDAWMAETGIDPFAAEADVPVEPQTPILNDPGMRTGGTTIAPKGYDPRAPTLQEQSAMIEDPGFAKVLGNEAGTRFTDNAIGLGQLMLDAGSKPNWLHRQLGLTPPSGTLPSSDQIVGTLKAIPQIPDIIGNGEGLLGEFQQRSAREAYLEKASRDKQPTAQAIGRTGGDIASLLTGRSGFVKKAAKAVPRAAANFTPGTARAAQRWFAGPKMQRLARGAGHTGTVGFEEALLAASQDGSPGTAAAIAAAGQAGGSLALSIGKLPLSVKGLAATAIGLTALIQMGKEATPGGQNRILESSESAFQKMVYTAAVAGVAGLGGSGRLSARHGYKIGQDMPLVADAITGIPRGTAMSIVAQVTNENRSGSNRIERTLTELAGNPGVFTDKERSTLTKGINSGDIAGAIDTLSKDVGFQEKLRAMR